MDLEKGLSAELPAFAQDIPTYRITNMWVCGGTGPDYGGVGVIDILTKPNYWNNEDGRGITALLVLHADSLLAEPPGKPQVSLPSTRGPL